MPGERKKHISNSDKNMYGVLNMRSYVIFGNDINAFYDKSDDLVFVLDNTVNPRKPNVLLVMNPDGDKKWDEILSDEYMVDLETIRPKQDNKYQKLDIEYSGLAVYENLINAYNADEDLTEYLAQLDVLRDSASRHSAVIRLNAANEIIDKANNTIVKTKDTIADLQTRLKTLRAKLSAQKKEIGKIPTKQSASKILRTESQIEATNEKLKRAKKRLESAQKRLELATNDAELASAFLNQPVPESKVVVTKPKSKQVISAPKYEVKTVEPDEQDLPVAYEPDDEPEEEPVDDEINSDVVPLLDSDPEILDENIAFKPISFDAPVAEIPYKTSEAAEDISEPDTLEEHKEEIVFSPVSENVFNEPVSEEPEPSFENVPMINTEALLGKKTDDKSDSVLDAMRPVEVPESKSVLESMTPVSQYEPVAQEEIVEQQPINIVPVTETDESDLKIEEPVYQPTVPEIPAVKPEINNFNVPVEEVKEHSKPTFIYYLLLLVLIALSVFTLWLYQKHTAVSVPVLTPKTAETVAQPKTEVLKPTKVVLPDVVEETVFLDEVEEEPQEETTVIESVVETSEPVVEESEEEPTYVDEKQEYEEEPEFDEEIPSEPEYVEDEDEVFVEPVVNKPEYDAGSKHEDMFVLPNESDEYFDDDEMFYDEGYDAEEAAYQSGNTGY